MNKTPQSETKLQDFVSALARAIGQADNEKPIWTSPKGREYQPGIGPHTEKKTLELATDCIELTQVVPSIRLELSYPHQTRNRCDVAIGDPVEWAIEVKMFRRMGDNGSPNDNMMKHILSPYSQDRSALTDCSKLLKSGFNAKFGIVIYGYDYPEFPMDPGVDAFEVLANKKVKLGKRLTASFDELVHPVHKEGRVFGWEIHEK